MEPLSSKLPPKDANNGMVVVGPLTTGSSVCSSDSFSIFLPPHHHDHNHHHNHLTSANSIELNAAASLSDDSGVPLTTNSSISSGDSYRLGMCKFESDVSEGEGRGEG